MYIYIIYNMYIYIYVCVCVCMCLYNICISKSGQSDSRHPECSNLTEVRWA